MADKKISQLPKINALSGSNGGEIIVPLVHDGTTQKMEIGAFAKYVSQHSAQTGSANTFYGTQTFTGNVNVNGKLTVHEIYANYETASIIFSSGSNVFGDQPSDIHTFVGTINLNGLALGDEKLMAQTASQAAVNLGISSTTGSINTTTSSFDSVFQRISSTTGSINTTTSSFDSVFQRISSTTGSINNTTSSFDLVFQRISSTTGSINTTTSSFDSVFQRISSTTGSINTTTSSFDAVFLGISSVTGSINSFTASVGGQVVNIATFSGSVNFATQSLNTQTGSQDLVNRGISSVTGSINTTTSSFDSVFLRISSTTGSINTTTSSFNSVFSAIGQQTASQDLVNRGISSVTGSINVQSSSQDLVNRGISSVTGSINTTTSSFDLVFRGISSVTGAINTTTSSFNSVFSQIGSTTSSLIGITNGLMAFTAALDATYATDAQLYQLYQATASIHSTTASLNTQTGSQANLNAQIGIATSSLNTFSGSIRSEINLLEAYTASLKAAAIVSSSTQITNYYKFAETASANTFYGNQTFNNDVRANKFVFTDGVINTNVGGQYVIATSGNVTYLYTGTSGLNINDATNGNINVSISNVGAVQTRGKLTVGAPGNDQDIAFGGSNAKLDWAGTGAQIFYSVGALQFSSVGTTNNMVLQQQAGALFNAGITGSLMATNNVVSSSNQIQNYNLFAYNTVTSSAATTFYGKISIATTQSAAPLTIKEQGAVGAPLFRFYGHSSNGDYMRGNWISQDGETSLAQLTVNGTSDVVFGSSTTAPLKLYTNAANAVEINYLAGANFAGAVTASNFKVPSGGGIDFSATSNGSGTTTSELLNDYEEGTWTPVITDATTGGNNGSGTFVATYTKIGRLVTLQASLGSIDTTGLTAGNTVYIKGLPFAIAGSTQTSAGAANFYNVTFGDCAVAWINAAAGTDYVRILKQTSGGANAGLIVSNITSTTGEISFTIQYYA